MIERIPPMLAVAGEPFDSDHHLYEVKWDGVRCLAAVEPGRVRLWGRKLADYTARYPELDTLGKLPSGTVVDGELVVLRDGKADLDAVLQRHRLTGQFKTMQASRQSPVVYVVVDLLLHGGRSLMGQPLCQRREILADTLGRLHSSRAVVSKRSSGSRSSAFSMVFCNCLRIPGSRWRMGTIWLSKMIKKGSLSPPRLSCTSKLHTNSPVSSQ